MKQMAQEHEIMDHIRQRYRGREALIGVVVDRQDGHEANWTARAEPALGENDDKRAFLQAVFQVQRLYDLADVD